MTQMIAAREGRVTKALSTILEDEPVSRDYLLEEVAVGRVAVLANRHHLNNGLHPMAVGKGTRIKVNANLGTSYDRPELEDEIGKMKVSLAAGADTVMDLSTGGDLDVNRVKLLDICHLPFGTVPLYQAEYEVVKKHDSFMEMTGDDLIGVIKKQAEDGVDFMTIHAGIRLKALDRLETSGRLTKVVSRGGGLLVSWMREHNRENPLYDRFEEILDICLEHDVTVSLGDGMRPGSLHDATDQVQLDELYTLGELVMRCRDRGVQSMVEGPGHVPLDQIEMNMKLQKRICHDAPFYVLGPLVTDVAAGWDHITGAIGGALAAWVGADYLCYVTPAEHLALPTAEEVHRGVIAFRIAAHAADIARGLPGAREWDDRMSQARFSLDWKEQFNLAMDPVTARKIHSERGSGTDACSMCGPFCPMHLNRDKDSEPESE